MLQKIQKKIQEFLKEKGQGVVEYALILGFVAIIGVYLVTQSGMKDAVKNNVSNAKAVLTDMDAQYDSAATATS
ncbi:MAG: hypothetical protein IJK81_09730 [Selenomonadaceae bacterium]|nr:hypothetical protein [Selenomonadaceae bacterium]